ncbi:hypothetical protein [Enterococcus sp. BWB1-3]|uniref:hypothetical protein n=1 Tax=Enterococcus sp. BWB1-3 TaxID=2787713 RepID=UPI001F3E0FB8|nr:hypothetical protein [Enterococcus sp. BWB1-3]
MDYTLREVHRYYDVPLHEIHSFLNSLKQLKGQMVLDELIWGEWFVEQYNKVVVDFFYEPLNIYSNYLLKQVIHYAMNQEIISESDFLLTDNGLLQKIQSADSWEIKCLLDFLQQPPDLKITGAGEDFDIFHQTKSRSVDPFILVSEEIVTTSEKSIQAKRQIQKAIRRGEEGLYLKIQQ